MVITLINHSDSPQQAFRRGLWKGMAAPLMLFAANRAPIEPVELAPLPPIRRVQLPESLTSMSDMGRIASDFWTVVRRYEQEGAEQPTLGSQTD